MIDKYFYDFPNSTIKADISRLINQIWKLLPMRENKEDWQKQLNSVVLELRGLHELFGDRLDFLILITKLLGLKSEEDFMTYRISVFSAISLLTELNNSLNG